MNTIDFFLLYWKGNPLGRIIEVHGNGHPWMCGRLIPVEWPLELRETIEALSRAVDSDEELPDPPLGSGYYDDWSVMDPNGNSTEIMVPIVDFENEQIEWR